MSVDSRGQTLVEVFIEHRAQLRSIAKRIVGTADLADEVTQDSYLRLVEGACARNVDRPFCYCCQVVRNVAIDYCRRQRVEAKVRVYTDEGDLPEVPVLVCPAQRLDDRRLICAIDQVLSNLPPRTRQAFELFRLGEVTQREIGVRLGCSATLVNFMVKDALEALKALKMRRDLIE